MNFTYLLILESVESEEFISFTLNFFFCDTFSSRLSAPNSRLYPVLIFQKKMLYGWYFGGGENIICINFVKFSCSKLTKTIKKNPKKPQKTAI